MNAGGSLRLLGIHLRMERAGIIGWSVGLLALALAVGASYSAIAEDAAQWEELLGSFDGLADAFGVDSLTSPDGYFRSNSVVFYPLLLGIYGGLAATKSFAGAQEQGRLDHVLARPISRRRYLFTASGALGIGQVAIIIAAGLGAVFGYLAADQDGAAVGGVFVMTLEVLPIALVHLALAILAGTLLDRRATANAVIMAIVVGGFALDIIGKLVDGLDWLEYVTPYGWWGRSDWYNGEMDGLYLVASVLVLFAAMAGAALRFDTKDL